MNKITIIIPCFNEADSLKELFKQLDQINPVFNFIILDNGSTDNTQQILNNIEVKDNIQLIKKEINTGYGAGIKFGLKNIDTDYCGWIHADLQQDIKVLLNAKKLIDYQSKKELKKKLAFKGLRSGRALSENFFTVGVAILSSLLFFRRCWDIAGQPNIYRTSELNFLDNAPDDHNFEFYIYIKFLLEKGTFKRFNAPFHKRKYGVSSWDIGIISKLKQAIKIFKYIVTLRFNLKS